jgi:hypothetical protein
MSDEQALTPQPSIAVPANLELPKLGRGHEEESDMSELEIPRAQLVQFTSGTAQAEDKTMRKDPGTIINSITLEEVGDYFIPIFKFTNFIQWNPRKKDDPNFDPAFEPGELMFTTTDRRDPRVVEGIKFGPNGESPKVTQNMNFLCYFLGNKYPLVLTFSKSSFTAGKRLNTLTQMVAGDMFAWKYKLAKRLKEGNAGKYFVLEVAPAGKAAPEEYAIGEYFYNAYRGKTLKVHTEEKQKEESWPE